MNIFHRHSLVSDDVKNFILYKKGQIFIKGFFRFDLLNAFILKSIGLVREAINSGTWVVE